jgi:uncharacterized membrane protein YebE (DUF533 family)
MIDAGKILGALVRQGLRPARGGKRNRGRSNVAGFIGGSMKGPIALGVLGVAIAAFEHYSQGSADSAAPAPPSAVPPPPPREDPVGETPSSTTSPSPPAQTEESRQQSLLLIRAMIAAANADGMIDKKEREVILGRLEAVGLVGDERTFLMRELKSPPSIDSLLPQVKSAELAGQVYAASLLAIEIDTQAERDYLHYLRLRLGIDEMRAADIHRELNLATVFA